VKNPSPKYRPDIDGLRAIAIMLVLAFHAFPNWSPGGFIGVDVFFVISGFLITSTILNELDDGRFSIIRFYGRRFRRIVPALALVLVASWMAGYLFFSPEDFSRLGKHLIAGASFTSNLLLNREAGYFDSASDLKPFLHLWSLGVEEQFYVLWPIILMLSFFARWNLLYVTGILLIASFALNVGTIKENHSNVFYLLPGRLWELLVGCGVAINQFRRPTQRASTKPIIGVFISLISLSALFMGAAFFNKHSIFPDWRALVPTIASMLFILSGPHAWFNRIILSNPLLIGIGLISYPLYLWHWPILSVARIIQETHQLD
jgi:peptidoglycan/LPS O-acetylase OafA/YrhL